MKRGDIYFANVDPARGADTKKTRPVLIISNDANNKMAATVTVIPITSNTKRVYPFEVLLKPNTSGLSKTSKAQCHQIRTISKLIRYYLKLPVTHPHPEEFKPVLSFKAQRYIIIWIIFIWAF